MKELIPMLCPVCNFKRLLTIKQINTLRKRKDRRYWPPTCGSRSCTAIRRWSKQKGGIGNFALIVFLACLLPSISKATIVPIQFTTPCRNADSPREPYNPCDTIGTSTLTDLDSIIIWGQQLCLLDSLRIGGINVKGRECDTINVALDILDGHCYRLWGRSKDISGNISVCRGPELIIALPKLDFHPGLLGAYYDNMDFTNFKLSRIDSDINFEWGQGSPNPLMGVDEFSIDWTGKISVPYSGTWTHYLYMEDGANLTIGTTPIIQDLNPNSQHESSGSLFMQAGITYPFHLQYIARFGHAGIVYSWSHIQQPKQVVPSSALEQP